MKKLRVFFKTLSTLNDFIHNKNVIVLQKHEGHRWITIAVSDDFPGIPEWQQILYNIRDVTPEPTQVYADDLTW